MHLFQFQVARFIFLSSPIEARNVLISACLTRYERNISLLHCTAHKVQHFPISTLSQQLPVGCLWYAGRTQTERGAPGSSAVAAMGWTATRINCLFHHNLLYFCLKPSSETPEDQIQDVKSGSIETFFIWHVFNLQKLVQLHLCWSNI